MIRRRRVRVVLLFLLLLSGGAIVNVAVAWGCASLSTPSRDCGEPHDLVQPGFHNGSVYRSEASFSVSILFNRYIDPTLNRPDIPDNPVWIPGWAANALHRPIFEEDRLFVATGWPVETFWEEHKVNPPWRTIFQPGSHRPLPIRPIFSGFAINTIFYAAVLWMVFAFPFVLRRRRRIKRGLCPACAYPVGTSPVCTECGKPVTPKSVEPS